MLENQIDQENYNKESSWIASRSIIFRNIFFVEQTYVFLFQSSSIIIHSTLFQTTLIFFTMTFKNTSDKDKAFVDSLQQTRLQAFSFIVDSQHTSSFIAFNESNAEIIILNDMKVWKKRIYVLNRETDCLVKIKQRDKNEIQQLKAKLQAFTAITANIIIIAFLIVIYFEWSRYHKILDSLMFTDEKNSTWKNWSLDIWEKLAININIFSNELYKLSYIHSRLADDVVEVTQVRCNFNCDNFYLTINELLKKLAQLFHDSDKKDNYRRKCINLIQELKKFSDFFNQFQRLYIYLKYQKNVLVIDLKNKINSRLWIFWTAQMKSLIKLSDIWNYLIRLNNEHRTVQEIKNKLLKHDDSKIIISRATIAVQSSTLKSDWSKSRSAVLTNVKNADVLVEICFVCHKSDHSFRECLNQSIKVNAVDENYNHFELDTESEFESKN